MAEHESGAGRANRVRETAPAYGGAGGEIAHARPPVFRLTVGERGRLVLPAEVREQLAIKAGDPIALILEKDGTMSLKTRAVAIGSLRGAFQHLAAPGRLASDELIAERRRDAAIEDRKDREFMARHGLKKKRR